ncbi:hypothetical protein ACFX1X_014938 [Malus domestica]
MEGHQAVDVQQNKAEDAKLQKMYKEEIDQEYNLGYLTGYTGQDNKSSSGYEELTKEARVEASFSPEASAKETRPVTSNIAPVDLPLAISEKIMGMLATNVHGFQSPFSGVGEIFRRLEVGDDARGGEWHRAPTGAWGETYPKDERIQGRHGGYDPSTYQ